MTRDELAAFASDPHVHLGNHTVDHAILTAYDAAGIRDQIVGCQNDLQQMAGVRPTIISYPNGDHDERVLTASREAGLRWGITVTKRKNYPPFGSGPNDPLRLGRYTLWGDQDVDQQCRRHRSDLSLEGLGLKRPPGAPVSSVDGSRS
jgi:peptidoglycan/xylan/chitin deacetylase (PgdA/CDA1 family)